MLSPLTDPRTGPGWPVPGRPPLGEPVTVTVAEPDASTVAVTV